MSPFSPSPLALPERQPLSVDLANDCGLRLRGRTHHWESQAFGLNVIGVSARPGRGAQDGFSTHACGEGLQLLLSARSRTHAARSYRLAVPLQGDMAAFAPIQGVHWTVMNDALRNAWVKVQWPLATWLLALMAGEAVELEEVREADGAVPEPHQASVCFCLQASDGNAWLRFERLGAAAASERSATSADLASDMLLRLGVHVRGPQLRRAHAAVIRPGDVLQQAVLVATGTPASALAALSQPEGAVLMLGRSTLFGATLRADGTDAVAIELMPAPAGTAVRSSLSLSPSPLDTPMSDDTPAELDEVELPVTFEVARIHTRIGDLRRMGPGHVLRTEMSAQEPEVRILVDGQAVGRGRLVTVGEVVGVEVLRWNLSDG